MSNFRPRAQDSIQLLQIHPQTESINSLIEGQGEGQSNTRERQRLKILCIYVTSM